MGELGIGGSREELLSERCAPRVLSTLQVAALSGALEPGSRT